MGLSIGTVGHDSGEEEKQEMFYDLHGFSLSPFISLLF